MEPNFYENIVPEEDKEKKDLVKIMSNLLDESLDSFILLRKRTSKEKINIEIKKSEKIKIEPTSRMENIFFEINSFNRPSISSRFDRLRRIRQMEEENENLERLIENENVEVVG